MSPLPGWRLVWSLYGRFWCRSSLEVLRQWRTGARACGQGPCGAVSPATSRAAHRRPRFPQRPGSAIKRPWIGAAGADVFAEMATELSSATWIIGQRNRFRNLSAPDTRLVSNDRAGGARRDWPPRFADDCRITFPKGRTTRSRDLNRLRPVQAIIPSRETAHLGFRVRIQSRST